MKLLRLKLRLLEPGLNPRLNQLLDVEDLEGKLKRWKRKGEKDWRIPKKANPKSASGGGKEV